MVRVYESTHPEARLAIDRVQAGLAPPTSFGTTRWTAMVRHFNQGVWVYGAEHGAANSSTVATTATGGGAIVHGVHVCPCGHEGKPDACHWLTACPHGPSPAARAEAAAALRAVVTEVLGLADRVEHVALTAVDCAACVLCERPTFEDEQAADDA